MLGRLIQTAASYGRGNNTLESATEESHTRNLLYGQSHHVYTLAQSPPTSPHATPVFRPGSFDDRGGLELEEKDVRILIAQDAFGAEEKPTLLFDSRPTPAHPPLASHVRHVSLTGPRAAEPGDWKSQSQHAASTPSESHFRSRSSTMSGAATHWSRPARDKGTREEAFLECMFGVTSSTKAPSTTKMHILPGQPKLGAKVELHSRSHTDAGDQQSRRVALQRSRTSNTIVKSQHHPSLSGLDTEAQSHDSVLITRLFSVALSESVAPSSRPADAITSPAVDNVIEESSTFSSPDTQANQTKKPKLVERKVPAFAIGLIVNLPRHPESHWAAVQPRPTSRSALAHTLSSASSSYGSDMQNSWTFLNAIPESLSSSTSLAEEPDKRLETVINNEDVILRAIALLEVESTRILHQQLQEMLNHAAGPTPKTPKEKSMQRTNQRIISITDAAAVAKAPSLQAVAKQVVRRVIYALRIPRVVVGLGFGVGHWSDEARAAFRVCGLRQQNFFLFTLLTAYLGHHPQWLQRLAPEWYRRQYRMCTRQQGEQHTLYQRTVIISDQRAVARRLVFLLASFLPGVRGLDGLQKPGEDLSISHFSMSSPSSHIIRSESLRRAANRRMRENRLHSNSNDKALLSTSADSVDSLAIAERSRRFLLRKDSDVLSMKAPSLLPTSEAENNRNASATTTSALVSYPATPVAVFSTKRGVDSDSYFPPFADNNDSIATAGLASILRRSSSSLGNSSNMSSRWGSVISGLSDILNNRQLNPGDSGSMTAYSSAAGSAERRNTELSTKRGKQNALQEMVNQLEGSTSTFTKSPDTRFADHKPASSSESNTLSKQIASAPRLRVDNRDGVVDVDLDLPGFGKFDSEDIFSSPSKSMNRPLAMDGPDIAESIRSLRSIPATPSDAYGTTGTNVAGYLKRYHEDFSLHAVRPYLEFEEDLKRSMLAEPLLPSVYENFSAPLEDKWIAVCSTVIADMRTFSVRRLTLKRKYVSTIASSSPSMPPSTVGTATSKKRGQNNVQQKFVDEEVKDFDTALADAIEKVLDIGEAVQGPSVPTPAFSHSRTASSGTTKSNPPSMPAFGASSYTTVSQEYVRQDCRQVVLGALEDIVKDVCSDLDKTEKGRDIHGSRSFEPSATKEDMKQENILREGVKSWLLNLEQLRVY